MGEKAKRETQKRHADTESDKKIRLHKNEMGQSRKCIIIRGAEKMENDVLKPENEAINTEPDQTDDNSDEMEKIRQEYNFEVGM